MSEDIIKGKLSPKKEFPEEISRERSYLLAGFVVGYSNRIEDCIESALLRDAGLALKYLLDEKYSA